MDEIEEPSVATTLFEIGYTKHCDYCNRRARGGRAFSTWVQNHTCKCGRQARFHYGTHPHRGSQVGNPQCPGFEPQHSQDVF